MIGVVLKAMRNVMAWVGIIFVKGSASSWQPQGLCFYYPKGEVGRKSCTSLTEQVLKFQGQLRVISCTLF